MHFQVKKKKKSKTTNMLFISPFERHGRSNKSKETKNHTLVSRRLKKKRAMHSFF